MNGIFSYEYERDDYYCYPDSSVLRNKLGITDERELECAEREITSIKMLQLIDRPTTKVLDSDYIKRIHEHLFCDIYDWAGEFRQIDISKGNIFCRHELIGINLEALMAELKAENYLGDIQKKWQLAERLAYYMGDLNSIHPFREGNGRVQRIFIRELAARAGFTVNFSGVTAKEMIIASDLAFRHDYTMLAELILRSMNKE